MRSLLSFLVLAFASSAFAASEAHDDANVMLLRHGAIWTGDVSKPSAQSLLIEGSIVTAVGSDAEVAAHVAERKLLPKIIELAGRRVLPGLIDSHIHIVGGGLQLTRVDLNPARSREQTYALITKYARENPTGWVLGRGWAYDLWKPGLPTKGELDALVPDRPVFVRAYDGHSGWANSKALELAGITEKSPDPKNGKIVREPNSQKPSGALLEDAMELMWAVIPKPSLEEKRQAIIRAGKHAAANGLTTMCEVGGDLADFDLYEALDQEHLLPVRVVFGPSIDDGIEAYGARREKLNATRTAESRLTPGPLKGFVDGVIESGTATMLAPFADGQPVDPPHLAPAALLDQVTRADAMHLDVCYHAIGDGAVRSVLDAVEQVARLRPDWGRRPRVEHIETVAASDLPRFAQLGVIASMMPLHADPGIESGGGIWVKKVGPERLTRAFAFNDLRKAGAQLAFGSDWPVVTIEPLPAIAMAVTRKRADGLPRGGWVPKQGLAMNETLHAYTSRAAYATRLEKVTGMLKPGMAADVVVLDKIANLEKPASFFKTKVDLTLVAGKVAYQR